MKNLPRLETLRRYTQIRAQNLGGKGQNGSQSDANNGGSKIHETIANKGARHFLTESVATYPVERAKGTEPSCPFPDVS